MALTELQKTVIGSAGFAGWCLFLSAGAKLAEERRQEAELERQREIAAAFAAGAIAATVINAVTAQAGDDLEPADCSEVLVDHEDCPEECCDTAIRPSAVQ